MNIDELLATHAARRRTGTVWLVCLSVVVLTLDITIVNVALPDILASFNAGVSTAQWVVNAYVLLFASLLLSVGSASDRFGRKGLFQIGHWVFLWSSVACVLAPTSTLLIIARGGQGAGGAILFGTCFALIADVFRDESRERRAAAMGLAVTVGAAASAFGPLVGGAIVEVTSWRMLFAINVPLCGVALWLANRHLLSDRGRRNHEVVVDPLSVATVSVGLLALNFALVSDLSGWLIAIVASVVGVALLWHFGRRQLRLGSAALLDLNMFKVPSFSAITALAFIGRFVGFGMYPFLVVWLSAVGGLSPLGVGVVLLAMAVPMIGVSRYSAKLITRYTAGQLMAGSMAITALGLILGAFASAGAWWSLVPMLVVIGVGTGVGMPHMMNIAVDTAPPERAGMATGVANSALPLGTAVGVAVFGAILQVRVWFVDLTSVFPGSTLAGDSGAELALAVRQALQIGQLDQLAARSQVSEAQVVLLESMRDSVLTSSVQLMCALAAVVAGAGAVIAWRGIRDEDRWSKKDSTSNG